MTRRKSRLRTSMEFIKQEGAYDPSFVPWVLGFLGNSHSKDDGWRP